MDKFWRSISILFCHTSSNFYSLLILCCILCFWCFLDAILQPFCFFYKWLLICSLPEFTIPWNWRIASLHKLTMCVSTCFQHISVHTPLLPTCAVYTCPIFLCLADHSRAASTGKRPKRNYAMVCRAAPVSPVFWQVVVANCVRLNASGSSSTHRLAPCYFYALGLCLCDELWDFCAHGPSK